MAYLTEYHSLQYCHHVIELMYLRRIIPKMHNTWHRLISNNCTVLHIDQTITYHPCKMNVCDYHINVLFF